MTPAAIGIAGIVLLFALLALRVPVAIALGMVGAIGGGLINGFHSLGFILGSQPFVTIFPYSLSVIPLFVMMGVFAAHAGLSRALYDVVNAFIGHRRGGLASATIGACALFGAICGSSLATAATMGRVAMPEMRRRGYDDRLAAGAVAAGGTLGILIPPSIIIVIYALLTETSIGRLFAAAFLPGLVATLLYIGAVVVVTRIHPEYGPAGERLGWGRRLAALREVWQVLLLFGVVMGGIYLGWFTPTEAAAVGSFGAFLLTVVNGRFTWRMLIDSLRETAGTTGMIFLIFIGTSVFQFFLETSTLPSLLAQTVTAMGLDRWVVMAIVIAIYVVLGCFLDSLSMLLITIPLVFPMITSLGFDPIWFGILIVCVVEIGLITPPVGMNLFVIVSVSDGLRLKTVVRGVTPFIIADVVRVVLLAAFPAISLWLPSLMK